MAPKDIFRTGCVVTVVVGIFAFGMALLTMDRSTVKVFHLDTGKTTQVATERNRYLPTEAIIHKDYGKGWKCVEIDGYFLLLRDGAGYSVAVKVDSCSKTPVSPKWKGNLPILDQD